MIALAKVVGLLLLAAPAAGCGALGRSEIADPPSGGGDAAAPPPARAIPIDLHSFSSRGDVLCEVVNERLCLWSAGVLEARVSVQPPGDYEIVIEACSDPARSEFARLAVAVDGMRLGEIATTSVPSPYRFPARLEAGERKVAIEFVNDYRDPERHEEDRNLYVLSAELLPRSVSPSSKP